MYNGIGLTTPRGTGTSGHVVRNASALKPGQERGVAQSRYSRYPSERSHPRNKPVDKDILEHERKRQVEIKCLELQDELEEKGLNDGEIEERVDKFRHQLLENIDRLDFSGGRGIQAFEMQKIAAAKSKENHRMAVALHVEDDYVEGAAFDRELQELKRQKRLLARERDPLNSAIVAIIAAHREIVAEAPVRMLKLKMNVAGTWSGDIIRQEDIIMDKATEAVVL
ncbi:RNA-splicing factor [Coemansia sp. RSA 2559]|nr:RNA-splicing factor [Coemansia sp. RSA 2559]KAJ2845612.1 RNA-splicing factor [Coemansia erecta]